MISDLFVDQRFHYIRQHIFGYLDPKSLMMARASCQDWYEAIENSPKLWIRVLRKLRLSYLLIGPFWRKLVARLEVKDFQTVSHIIMSCDWKTFQPSGTVEAFTLHLVYKNLDRLVNFWPFIVDHFPKALYFIIDNQMIEIFDYFMENSENLDNNVIFYEESSYSPLQLACQQGNAEMVEKLLPYYVNHQVQLEYGAQLAVENGHTDLAFKLSMEYNIDLSLLRELSFE